MKRISWFLAMICTLLLVFGSVSSASAESLADNAEILNIRVPLCMETGKIYEAEVTVKNPGPSTWDESFRLGSQDPQDNRIWGFGRVFLPAGFTVKPGETYTFKFRITAPSDPGSYSFSWQIVHEGVRWVGKEKGVMIEVVQGPKNDAKIVDIVIVVPENGDYPHTTERFQAKVTVKNTGNTTWSKEGLYRLGSLWDEYKTWGIQSLRSYLADGVLVAPGESYDFFVELFAPAQTGTFILGVRMLEEGKQWFGEAKEIEIEVFDDPVFTEFWPNPEISEKDRYLIKEGSWEDIRREEGPFAVSFKNQETGLVSIKMISWKVIDGEDYMKTFNRFYLDNPDYIPGTPPFPEDSPPRELWGYHFSDGFSRPGGYYVFRLSYDEDQGRDLIFVKNIDHQFKILRDPETGEVFGFWDRNYVETGVEIFWPDQVSLAFSEAYWPEIVILIGNHLFKFEIADDRLVGGRHLFIDGRPLLTKNGLVFSGYPKYDNTFVSFGYDMFKEVPVPIENGSPTFLEWEPIE